MATASRLQQRRFRDATETAFVGLLVASEKLNGELDAVCAPHGLTHAQYNVLRILRGAHPEGLPRFEIANRLIRRAPDVTRLLDRLVRQGYIERGWSPQNRRLSVARVTAKGLKVLDAIEPQLVQLQRSALGRLSRAQIDALAETLDTLNT